MAEVQAVTRTRGVRDSQRWTPARWFLLAAAAVHLPLGLAGLVIDRSFPIGAASAATTGSARVFGVFQTNGWHSLAAVGIGLLALYCTVRPTRARSVALVIGVLHVWVVASLIITSPSTFWLASNNADQGVHAFSAIGGIVSGLLTPAGAERDG